MHVWEGGSREKEREGERERERERGAKLAPSDQAANTAWVNGGMRHVWEWGMVPWASYE